MTRAAAAAALLLAVTLPVTAVGRAVTLSSSDGTTLAATLYEPAQRPAPAVLLVHMLGRTKEDWEPLASRLESAGVLVLAIDLRGHGRSSGSMALLSPMIDDVRSALGWMAARPGVRPDGLAVVGASLGANLALLAAADNPAVRAIALLSPSSDYRGVRLDAAALKRVGGRSMWLAASVHDPYALRTIRDLAQGPGAREQYLSDVTAHGTNLLTGDPDAFSRLVDWLRRALIF